MQLLLRSILWHKQVKVAESCNQWNEGTIQQNGRKYLQATCLQTVNIQSMPATHIQKKINQSSFLMGMDADSAPREELTMANIWTNAQHHIPSGKCRSKPWGGITSPLAEWWKSKTGNSKCWPECGKRTILVHCKLVQSLGKTLQRFILNKR